MYIAMNRFAVKPGCEEDFEAVWRNREVQIDKVPGFLKFHLLRGPEREGHTLYSSHVLWRSQADFEAWTKSEAFRLAHRNAGKGPALTTGHPVFEGFEVVLALQPAASTASAA